VEAKAKAARRAPPARVPQRPPLEAKAKVARVRRRPAANASADLAGEAGETGARGAYDTVPADSRRALRIAHLKGFVLAAQAAAPVQGEAAASALVGQGLLEVYTPAAAEFTAAGVSEEALQNAAKTGSAAISPLRSRT
jgi:hypothetical protein